MPKIFAQLLTSLKSKGQKPREGYFVLFFAVVLTILMLPVLSSVLTNTVETRSQVANYYRAETARNQGESVLFNKLESLSRQGLGYFEKGTVFLDEDEEGATALPEEDRPRVKYNFSAASVITTPSKYDNADLNLANPATPTECSAWINEDDAGNVDLEDCSERPDLKNPRFRNPNYYYTVPALGTGDVGGADCQLGQIPSSDTNIDPLDHPCSWNQLSIGQNVAIPLYINTPQSPDRYEVFVPESLTLRLRFKCADVAQTYCAPEERLFITHENLDTSTADLSLIRNPDPTLDTTPRVLDWAIVASDIILPDQRGDFNTESGRRLDNIEITVQRMHQNTGSNRTEMFKIFRDQLITTVNFVNEEAKLLLISNAFNADSVSEILSSFFPPAGEGLLGDYEVVDGMPNVFSVTEDAPVLYLGFLNAYFEGCARISGEEICKQITEIEYQLISNVPLGNHKFVSTGDAQNSNSDYSLMKAEKGGPEVVTIPGTVFGS